MTARVATTITRKALEELVSQARQLGYPGGATFVYIRDRLEQLSDPLTFAGLPPVTPSWPPNRTPPTRRWFVKDGGGHLERRRAKAGERR